jgi:UPF0755 protein
MIKYFLNIVQKSALKLRRSFFILPIALVICTVVLSYISLIHFYTAPYTFNQKEINIPKGTSTWDALSVLHQFKILPHPLITLASTVLFYDSYKIMAGDYLFTVGLSPREVMTMLRTGQVIEYIITFPEGWTVHEILTAINNDNRLSGKVMTAVDEGSLFPSTYNIQCHQPREQLIHTMRTKMDSIVKELMISNQNPFIKTARDLIIFASILEKEAAIPEELPRISGVFINRLKKKMRLQSCPTVIYAKTLGKQKLQKMLTYDDLKLDSEYNTYRRSGLPIGAICCPGINALKAAVHPAKTNELFFIFDGEKHYFSVTYKEHLERKRNIRNTIRIINE